MTRLLRLALVAATLCACTSRESDTYLDIVYDPCAGVVVVPSSSDEAELASVDEALSLWSEVAPVRLGRGQRRGYGQLALTFADEPETLRGVYDDESGIVYVNQKLKNPRSRVITVAHELGHAFGLFHVTGRESVMNPANIRIAPNAQDAASLGELWPACRE